jgi:RNA recognition motif-containing protein
MVRNWANKNFKGFAYVDYRDLGSVKKAIEKYHGKPYRGRNLILDAVTTDQRKGFRRHDPNYNPEGNEDN